MTFDFCSFPGSVMCSMRLLRDAGLWQRAAAPIQPGPWGKQLTLHSVLYWWAMTFGRSDILNKFLTCDIFNLWWTYWGIAPPWVWGTPEFHHVLNPPSYFPSGCLNIHFNLISFEQNCWEWEVLESHQPSPCLLGPGLGSWPRFASCLWESVSVWFALLAPPPPP